MGRESAASGSGGAEIPWRMARSSADKSVVRGMFGSRLYPETWVIDPDGVIRVRVDGGKDWAAPIALEMIESVAL